jgi:formamidopyrimidine-DNA glycosylase
VKKLPELPTLEVFKKYFDTRSLHQKIKKFKVLNPEILFDITPLQLEKKLKGHEFVSSVRYGKYLFGKLDNDLFLIMHFGMTGYLKYSSKSTEHGRVIVSFQNGNILTFDDARKFGKIGLTNDIEGFIAQKKLGPDALQINLKSFQKMFINRSGMIKPLIMNQNFIAGIGNLYADEILYQTCIHPKTPANLLTNSELNMLYKNMKNILNKAVFYMDSPSNFPDSYLLSHRNPRGKCPDNSGLEIIKVGGRTTYLCPNRQHIKK